MVSPLYVSGLLLRVTRIGVKACIDVTPYAELFITSIIEKHVLIYSKDNFFWLLSNDPHSWIILVTLDWFMARHTSGAVHNIAYYRAYVWSIGDDLRPFSLFCRGRALTLNFIPYNSGKNSFFVWSILNTFKIMSRYVLIWKYHLAFLIYPHRSWCSMFKQLYSRFSIEKHLSNNPICFPEILHHFWSTICQQDILIRNSIVLPLTSLEIQVSHKLCINPKSLIISSKRTFQLRDAYSSP